MTSWVFSTPRLRNGAADRTHAMQARSTVGRRRFPRPAGGGPLPGRTPGHERDGRALLCVMPPQPGTIDYTWNEINKLRQFKDQQGKITTCDYNNNAPAPPPTPAARCRRPTRTSPTAPRPSRRPRRRARWSTSPTPTATAPTPPRTAARSHTRSVRGRRPGSVLRGRLGGQHGCFKPYGRITR